MQIEGWDVRSVVVYKGKELLDETPEKKDQEKEIRTITIRRKRERTVCILA